ncbi:MAG TPA: thioesterase family protein [Burkholderiales bacterium]|nr:thioesterase family protein [Burkholderiales bacterium]
MSNPERGAQAFKTVTEGWDGRTYVWPVRIYYHHTDAGGVVHHGTYLDFMEAARTELLHAHGFDLAELADRESVLFMVYRLAVDYHKSARLNDPLRVTATIAHAGRVRIDFDQRVMRGDELLVSAQVRAACVDPRTFKPVAMPEALREKLTR